MNESQPAHIASVLEALAQDILTARTPSDAVAIGQSLRDVASLCFQYAETIEDEAGVMAEPPRA